MASHTHRRFGPVTVGGLMGGALGGIGGVAVAKTVAPPTWAREILVGLIFAGATLGFFVGAYREFAARRQISLLSTFLHNLARSRNLRRWLILSISTLLLFTVSMGIAFYLRQAKQEAVNRISAIVLQHGASVTGGIDPRTGTVDPLNWRVIDFSGTNITDADMEDFSVLPALHALSFANTRISDQSVSALEGVKSLGYLDVGDTDISGAGIRRLQQALPNCTISTVTAAMRVKSALQKKLAHIDGVQVRVATRPRPRASIVQEVWIDIPESYISTLRRKAANEATHGAEPSNVLLDRVRNEVRGEVARFLGIGNDVPVHVTIASD